MARAPEGPPPPPTVQRVRLRYTKRGRLRFTSHRDFARALERALRRAGVPMAYSAGFNPHPKISYVGAAPTGVASEAEYVEIGLAERCDPGVLGPALDRSLPVGLDIVEAVEVPPGAGSLAERMVASSWRLTLPGVDPGELGKAVTRFLAAETAPVERATKNGRRTLDARAAVLTMTVEVSADDPMPCAILNLVVRHATPTVRPDDVLAGLRLVAGLTTPVAPAATRLAQGPLEEDGRIADPLAPDRAAAGDVAGSAAARSGVATGHP